MYIINDRFQFEGFWNFDDKRRVEGLRIIMEKEAEDL